MGTIETSEVLGELMMVWAWGSQCELNGAVWTHWSVSAALGRAGRSRVTSL